MGIESLEELPALPDMNEADRVEKLQDAVEKLKSRGEQLEIDMNASADAEE